MANGGARDDNGSQFFLTLGRADELTGKHTMFGRVEAGNTIFNLVKMGEVDVGEDSERPLFPTTVTGAEVLVNPFEGMVARERVKFSKEEKKGPVVKKGKKKAAKQLLSFGGGDEGEDEDVAATVKAKFNPKLVNTAEEKSPAAISASTTQKRSLPQSSRAAEPPTKRRQTSASPPPRPRQTPQTASASKAPPRRSSASPSPSPSPPPTAAPSALDLANQQIAALKASLKRDVPTADSSRHSKPRSALEAMIPTTATRGRKRKGGGNAAPGAALSRDEQSALEMFTSFKRRLETAPVPTAAAEGNVETNGHDHRGDKEDLEHRSNQTKRELPAQTSAAAEDEEAAVCDLHFVANCQSCKKWDEAIDGQDDGENGDEEGEGWMSHQLSFAKDRLGKDLEWKRQNEKELVVIDPREREREIVGKKKAEKHGGKDRVKGGR